MEVRYNIPNFKYTTIEVPMAAGNVLGQFNFPINNYLIDRQVFGLEVFINTDIPNSPISTVNQTWNIVNMRAATLTLHTFDPTDPNNSAGKADWYKDLPCVCLHRTFNTDGAATGTSVFDRMTFAGIRPDWNNSYIRFLTTQVLTANTSAVFGVYYK